MSRISWGSSSRQILSRIGSAALVFALTTCARPASATTIAILTIPPTAQTRLLHDGLEEHARARNVLVHVAYAREGAGDQQVGQARRFIAEKVDALVVMPADPSAGAVITRLAQEADIPLVYVNNWLGADWSAGRVVFVMPNDLVAGRLQMRKLAQMLNGVGRVALIGGHASHPGSALRTRGAKEVMAEFPGLRLVAETITDGDRLTARSAVTGWLAKGIRIDAIAATNDEMAIGAAEAIAAVGLPAGRILIGGVDATADGMQAMQDKRLAVTIYQDAATQSRRAIDDALALIQHEPVQQYDWMPSELITDRISTTHFSR